MENKSKVRQGCFAGSRILSISEVRGTYRPSCGCLRSSFVYTICTRVIYKGKLKHRIGERRENPAEQVGREEDHTEQDGIVYSGAISRQIKNNTLGSIMNPGVFQKKSKKKK